METSSIFDLLGLAPDTDAAHLRDAYECAVGAATKRGDWTRAAALSRAFDALPRATRLAVYSGRDRDAARWQPEATKHQRRTSRPVGQRRSCQGWTWQRILLPVLSAIVALGTAATWYAHRSPPSSTYVALGDSPTSASPMPARPAPDGSRHVRHRRPTRPRPAIWSPMYALYPGSGEVRIPRDAILDADGYAHVRCPVDAAGSLWQPLRAVPGQYFTCPSGFVGVVLTRRR